MSRETALADLSTLSDQEAQILNNSPELLSKFQAKHGLSQPQSTMQQIGSIADQYKRTQFGSPSQLLQGIPQIANHLAGKAGQFATEQLSHGNNAVDPYTAAGVGTLISMGPDIAMTGNPGEGTPDVVPEAAIPMQRRALGFQKTMLKTPFARGRASLAAKTALEQGVASATGNPDVMLQRANALQGKVGAQLGAIRDSVGPQPIDQFVDALDQYKAGRLKGAQGGRWDAIANKIEEAKDTVRGLLGGQGVPGNQQVISRNIPGEPGIPGMTIPGSNPASTGTPDVITGAENMPTSPGDLGVNRRGPMVISPRPAIPGSTSRTIVTPNSSLDPVMGVMTPPKKVGLNRVTEAKKQIGNIVNWLAENAGQSETKKITGALEKASENAIASSGGDIKSYKALKPIYAAAKAMQKGLNNEVAAQQGNNAISLPSLVAGSALKGNPTSIPMDIAQFLLPEFARRRGAGISASEIMSAANAGKNFGSPIANSASELLQYLRRKRD